MSDIVATIQAEQDAIIRSKPSGVLVVQGGPGTGKTAVALHRAAYLLYTHRDRLARRGVLVVGPNPTFLRYIGQVLPSLGETSVVLGTVGQLFPGLDARRPEPAATAAVKGRAEMAGVIAAAVRNRQQLPRRPIELVVEQQRVRLDRRPGQRRPDPGPALPQAAQRGQADLPPGGGAAARRPGGAATSAAAGCSTPATSPTSARSSPRAPQLTRELNELWPTLSAEQLLTDLFADPRRLHSVARRLPVADRDLLVRPAPAADVPAGLRWTPADVPLLDEAAELLGDDGAEAAAREAAALREEVLYAQGVLDVLDLEEDLDPELLRATDIVDADRLAERQRVRRYDSTADRAAADREWTYGHVIVDEAQELSPMAWRLIMRRCPSRSMTLVGDIAQTGDLAGASSWGEVLSPYVANRWRLEQLTVNYRTPAEIADVADDVLAVIEPGLAPPQLGAQHRGAAAGGPRWTPRPSWTTRWPRCWPRRPARWGRGAPRCSRPTARVAGAAGAAARRAPATRSGHPRRPGRPGRRPDLAGGGAADQLGQGAGVRRGGRGRAGGGAGREPARGQRPLRGDHPVDPAAGRGARGPAAGDAAPPHRQALTRTMRRARGCRAGQSRRPPAGARPARPGGSRGGAGRGRARSSPWARAQARTSAVVGAAAAASGSAETDVPAPALVPVVACAAAATSVSAQARPAAR